MVEPVTSSSRPGRALRRRKSPTDGVLRAAAAAGVAPGDLLCGDDAGRLAGYGGARPGRSLAAARRRGFIEGFEDPAAADRTVWFSRAALEQFRAQRGGTTDTPAGERDVGWAESDGAPGTPVGRVEHELELELVRLRERLAASEAERERLAAELARARNVAAALAEAMAASVAEPGQR